MAKNNSSTPESVGFLAIGASAGGLDSIERLLVSLDSSFDGVALLAQHLSPDYPSHLSELLARRTGLEVRDARDGEPVERNTLYVMPPGCSLSIEGHRLKVQEANSKTRHRLIDVLFHSLAREHPGRCAAVVLSGTGTDGTEGCVEVQQAGGLTVAEDSGSAAFTGMPSSVVAVDAAHLVLAAEDIGPAVERFLAGQTVEQLMHETLAAGGQPFLPKLDHTIPDEVLSQLLDQAGHDFRLHREETLGRRFGRRLRSSGLSVDDYANRLAGDPEEVRALCTDLLIGVTRFFRDKSAFDALSRLLDDIVASLPDGDKARIWSAGCASGEEAYTVAILIAEAFERAGRDFDAEIFATDILGERIEYASRGVYPAKTAADLSSARRERWFETLDDGALAVRPELRDKIFFSIHDLTRDVPFSGLHLITCRNLIIYLRGEAQRSVLLSLLYGLEMGGHLFLGSSESPAGLESLCEPIDETHRIFRKISHVDVPEVLPKLFAPSPNPRPTGSLVDLPRGRASASPLLEVYDHLLDIHMPPSFLVNERLELIECFSGAERFLTVPARRLKTRLFDLLASPSKPTIATSVSGLDTTDSQEMATPVVLEDREGKKVDALLRTTRLPDRRGESFILVSVIEREEPLDRQSEDPRTGADARLSATGQSNQVRMLEGELTRTRQNLQDVVKDLAISNQEFQTSNQELAATNEELQSSNEELRSVNDELQRLNDEYQKIIQELRVANSDLKYMFEATDIGLVFLDEDLVIRRFTQAVQKYLRIRSIDVGRSLEELATTLPEADLISMLEEVVEDGGAVEREFYDENGDKVLVGVRSFDESEDRVGAVLTFTDLSAVQPHRREAERMKAILATTGDAIWSTDLVGRVTTWNEAATELFGYDFEEVMGDNAPSLFPEGGTQSMEEVVALVIRDRRVSRVSTRVLRRGGTLIDADITVSAIEDAESEIVGVSFVARDTRNLRESIRKLQRSENRYHDLFEFAPDAYLVIDPESAQIVNCNETLLELLGFEQGDVVGRSLFELLGDSDDAAPEGDLASFLASRDATSRHRMRVTRKDGTELDVSMSLAEVRDQDDDLEQIRLIWRDISQQIEVERNLRIEIGRRDRYLAILSHELRNPLNALRTANRLLARRDSTSEHREYALRVIDQQTGHMARLLEDLLDTARVIQQKLDIRPQPLRVGDVLDAALDSVRGVAEEKQVEIEVEADTSLYSLADPDRVQQAIANLLNNAVKYCDPENGRVRVRLVEETANGESWVVCEVEDNGAGIPATLLPRVFDLFTQADDTLDRSGGGMGLGLALVKAIADLHGGFVDASSDGFGHGSSFRFGLPTGHPVEFNTVCEDRQGEERRVLIVEDQEDSRVALATLLELDGHVVFASEDGPSALEMLDRNRPEVVLLDIGLPGMDGYEVARRIRERLGTSVKLIALTGYGNQEDVERAMEAGFDHHLIKPVDPDRLALLLS